MHRTRVAAAVVAVIAASGGAWYASRADEAPAARPQVKVLLENDRVRMREILLPPGSSTGQHTHKVPELSYAFTDASLKVTVPGSAPVIEQWHAGEAHWRDAGVTHEIANAGDRDARVLVIDVK
jgi:quercetin dioxygenase-like cupin family protein